MKKENGGSMGRNNSRSYDNDDRTKVVVWICEYGCGMSNSRLIAYRRIINDDICDYCDKYYHEPRTVITRNT